MYPRFSINNTLVPKTPVVHSCLDTCRSQRFILKQSPPRADRLVNLRCLEFVPIVHLAGATLCGSFGVVPLEELFWATLDLVYCRSENITRA